MIAISAGHYPERPGACSGEFCEHGEAQRWAVAITDHLIRGGTDARLVPTGVLRSKIDWINDHDAELAIEIHFNSDPGRAGRGCEVLYYPESQRGAYLADELLQAIEGTFPPSRGIKEGWYQMNRTKGVDFFLAKTGCPSAIIEPEFIHNTDVITENRDKACEALANKIMKVVSDGIN